MLRSTVGPALALLLASGCFSYHPLPPASAPEGARVRVSTASATADRVPQTLEGTLLSASGGELRLRVQEPRGPAGSIAPPLERDVSLELADVVGLEVRRLDRLRTAALVAAVGTVGGLWVAGRFDAAGGSGGGPAPGGGDNALLPSVPVFQLSVPSP